MSGRRMAASLAVNALMVAGAIVTLVPLLWMVSASLMPAGEASAFPPRILPSRPTLDHYAHLFTQLDLETSLLNSALIAVLSTVLSLLVNSMAGYAFAKLRFGGRDRLFAWLLAGLIIPAQVAMLPLFLLLKTMGLVNAYAGAMIPLIATIYGVFLVRQFMLSIPDDLIAAARVDGASEWEIYWKIVMPLSRPILATLAIFTFMSAWNDFMWPLIILTDDDRYTLPVAVANLSGEHVMDLELMMAASVVTVMPVLGLFLALQRYYIAGIMVGSVKG